MTKHGLILDFLSSFTGQVDFLHMEPEQASSYKEGDEVQLFLLLFLLLLFNVLSVFKLECSMNILVCAGDSGSSVRVVRGAVHPSGGPEPAQLPRSVRSQG